MILNAYAVYDAKSRSYARPFFVVNADVAVRMFTQLANDPNTEIGRYPTDFTLYCVGSYDDELGAMYPAKELEVLGVAANFKEVVHAQKS